MQELYKNKGPLNWCCSYRDIHLKDKAAKVFHSSLRDSLHDHYIAGTQSTQYGGINHRGCDDGIHIGRAFAEYCSASSLSCALLFLDLAAVFASIMRELLFSDVLTDAKLCHIFAKSQMPAPTFHDLCELFFRRWCS